MAIHPWNISFEKLDNAFCLYMLPFEPSASIPKRCPKFLCEPRPALFPKAKENLSTHAFIKL